MKDQALLLVAEDDPDDQYFFQEAVKVVRPDELEMHFVLNGAQLLNFLRGNAKETYRRKLIVLDLNMRVKDGLTTLREIKADNALADIPVVVLTTSDNQEDMEYCRQYGVAAYYRKPSSIVELVKIIRELYRNFLN
ncbi:MAG TPA: response regulator [Anaerolineales bacterium]|nr:response regulator [Anaerolineales bacterium]